MSEGTGHVTDVPTWTAFGPRRVRPRANLLGAVLAVMFAWPAMTAVDPKYPAYMITLALGAASWFTYLGVKARALVALLLLPVAMLWLNPLFGAEWFNRQGALFFLPHAVFAMLLGIAAYTYAATEKR
jgi:hypothetical protein